MNTTTPSTTSRWRKSSYSSANGACVEVAPAPEGVAVRDSKHPDDGMLLLRAESWTDFLHTVKAGRFDLR